MTRDVRTLVLRSDAAFPRRIDTLWPCASWCKLPFDSRRSSPSTGYRNKARFLLFSSLQCGYPRNQEPCPATLRPGSGSGQPNIHHLPPAAGSLLALPTPRLLLSHHNGHSTERPSPHTAHRRGRRRLRSPSARLQCAYTYRVYTYVPVGLPWPVGRPPPGPLRRFHQRFPLSFGSPRSLLLAPCSLLPETRGRYQNPESESQVAKVLPLASRPHGASPESSHYIPFLGVRNQESGIRNVVADRKLHLCRNRVRPRRILSHHPPHPVVTRPWLMPSGTHTHTHAHECSSRARHARCVFPPRLLD
ncbi:hypothetical protein L227DRAFT_240574 [Lentinus tigrinus ALCF2SS1-6]|uniref:Uncharacterized protein n=1 Tax=Lentinus tigrinus ALCF2SS1-6 TaxID=1328759 RepID=A0A5C2S0L7_9APHY|nr:hypothetical protein L227DRAFT_240574 [Lentinus tigrinus ALCF2SS1-6]